jgi:hypothetical protein
MAKAYNRSHPKKLWSGMSYQSRFVALRDIGFSSYAEYLASDLWQEIRQKVFKIKGRFCYLCGRPATELHHNRYHRRDLLGKRLKFINPICRKCHGEIEFREGKKSTVAEARKAFQRARRRMVRGS